MTALTPSLAARLRALTPARVGLGRVGVSLETRDQLDFQRAHAQARDAVHARLDASALVAEISRIAPLQLLRLHSAAPDRPTYLQRPDLGRRLSDSSRELLARHAPAAPHTDLAIVLADGLSALAAERHGPSLVAELFPRLETWSIAPLTIVEQARVAIGDEIGLALGVQIVVVLIGERPGLSSPDSLGAYITWQPRPGRSDAERNCISNIRAEGLPCPEAAAQLACCLSQARRLQLTGVALKQPSHLLEES
jgi:ethanolamine ammonia-lyase small subunit